MGFLTKIVRGGRGRRSGDANDYSNSATAAALAMAAGHDPPPTSSCNNDPSSAAGQEETDDDNSLTMLRAYIAGYQISHGMLGTGRRERLRLSRRRRRVERIRSFLGVGSSSSNAQQAANPQQPITPTIEQVMALIPKKSQKRLDRLADEMTALLKQLLHLRLNSIPPSMGPVTCAVCAEEMEPGQIVTRLPCGHLYHSMCILQWFLHSSERTKKQTQVHNRQLLLQQEGQNEDQAQSTSSSPASSSRRVITRPPFFPKGNRSSTISKNRHAIAVRAFVPLDVHLAMVPPLQRTHEEANPGAQPATAVAEEEQNEDQAQSTPSSSSSSSPASSSRRVITRPPFFPKGNRSSTISKSHHAWSCPACRHVMTCDSITHGARAKKCAPVSTTSSSSPASSSLPASSTSIANTSCTTDVQSTNTEETTTLHATSSSSSATSRKSQGGIVITDDVLAIKERFFASKKKPKQQKQPPPKAAVMAFCGSDAICVRLTTDNDNKDGDTNNRDDNNDNEAVPDSNIGDDGYKNSSNAVAVAG
eukprot:CAMPEP_0119570438 /NCGR_PEP_ID=MMETSP1352-20130426/43611_1 /TAXON_ID=265584 /ORGANISM="Stauroneis constricta, Strain CCMP1120" /LENGTH=532 /DNA_ID=CAMNT_0007620107 /DNA_START=625 /DNA_END=2224 /DNA_ORIENTATION=-